MRSQLQAVANEINSRRSGRWVFLTVAVSCFLLRPVSLVGIERAPVTIYFYSPESSINNYGLLKDQFDGYLAKFGKVKFQPFKSREYFDGLLAGNRGGLYLISSWHYKQLPRREGLIPVLVGELDGRTTQIHALWARSYTKNMAALSGATIATARSKQYTAALMTEMTGDETGEWVSQLNLKFMEVPKDIDALLAVSFGAAGVAIATQSAGDKLAETNPKQWETLKVLSQSRPSLLPVVVVPRQEQALLLDLIRILTDMKESAEGRECLKTIGLDGFKILEPDQVKELMQ